MFHNVALFDKNFTDNEFRKVMTFLGGAVLILTAINTYLSIRINLYKVKEIKKGTNLQTI